jgi:uncharacterized protein YbjT (DUF2867 family)
MRLLVLGASGGTGRHIVAQAREAGHDVTAYTRDRGSLTEATPALGAALQGQDAVISAIGRGKSFKSEQLIQRSLPGILSAMQAAGVRRLVFMSALGVGESMRDTPILARLFMRTLLRDIYADKIIGDDLIRRSGLDWTIVQPSVLNDGPLTKRYRSGERLALRGMPSISRADTAHFIVGAIGDPSSIRKTLVISN